MSKNYFLLLAGGVGAAKLIEGLANVVNPESLKIVVNTGDDIELFGLKICPDLDIITYTLANLVDKKKGWGYSNETYNCLSVLKRFYDTGWFNAGDKDLATHIYRSDLFKQGYNKAEITTRICEHFDIKAHVIPMCNEPVETHIKTPLKVMHFEEYFIKYRCEPQILDVQFKGIENSKPVEGVLRFIENAKNIIICPSNPIVSIGTILQVPHIKNALKRVKRKVFAISPIIQSATVKGPADKMMQCFGLEISCVGVARFYQEILGHFIIDERDHQLKPKIEDLGIKTYCYDILMSNLEKKKNLANFLLNII